MKRRIVAAVALIAVALLLKPDAAAAQAPDPETRKLAQELVDLTITPSFSDMMIGGSWPALEQMLRQNPLKLSDDEIAKLKADFMGILRKQLNDVLADTPDIYAKYFSAAELRDMLAFYQTETGRKTVTLMPKMTQEIMEKTNERAPAMMGKIMESFQAILKERGVKMP